MTAAKARSTLWDILTLWDSAEGEWEDDTYYKTKEKEGGGGKAERNGKKKKWQQPDLARQKWQKMTPASWNINMVPGGKEGKAEPAGKAEGEP